MLGTLGLVRLRLNRSHSGLGSGLRLVSLLRRVTDLDRLRLLHSLLAVGVLVRRLRRGLLTVGDLVRGLRRRLLAVSGEVDDLVLLLLLLLEGVEDLLGLRGSCLLRPIALAGARLGLSENEAAVDGKNRKGQEDGHESHFHASS